MEASNMKNLILSSVLVLIASTAAQAQEAVQWKVSDGGNGHWYRMAIPASTIPWVEAKVLAESMGGHLATIRSDGENIVCLSAALGGPVVVGGSVWLGGLQPDGESSVFAWLTGEPFDWTPGCGFSNTEFGCGYEDRLTMTSPWTECPWNDVAECWLLPAFLVEWSADCNNDGIVDYGQCRDGTLADYNGNNVPDCCESGTSCVAGNYPVQWRIEDGGNGHWYQVREAATGDCWDQSRIASAQIGGYLVTITSAAENGFLVPFTQRLNAPNVTIGGYKDLQSNVWRWVTDEPWQFTNWQAGEPGCCLPNEWWLDMAWSTGKWRDRTQCISPAPAQNGVMLIEWSADCNSDGIVDYGQILQGQLVDADVNGVPDVCEVDPCPGDITNGGTVDAADLSILLAAWGTNGQAEFDTDIDSSGLVDGGDLALVLGGWGPCPQ